MIRSPQSDRLSTEASTMPKDSDIAELRNKLQQQERIILRLQEQQQASQTASLTGNTELNLGTLHFSIRDALEAVPNFDGYNIAFCHFVEGCEEALSMISPSQEIVLVRAIRNKLKGDAHKSILGKVFDSLRSLVEFLRKKYGPRETVYETQARLAYLCQSNNEKVASYANRVRELGKRIMDAQQRQFGTISREFEKSVEDNIKISFLRGLNREIRVTREGTFEELESRAIDAERELETIQAIRQVVLGEKAPEKRSAPLRRIGTEVIKCQYCHKIGHTADRCRSIRNGSNQLNYNNTRILPHPRENNTRNLNRVVTCRYCKKPGHMISECRKRQYNNNRANTQIQGNDRNPASTGAITGNNNTRPTRPIISVADNTIEQ